jgi:hypothetical protein
MPFSPVTRIPAAASLPIGRENLAAALTGLLHGAVDDSWGRGFALRQ